MRLRGFHGTALLGMVLLPMPLLAHGLLVSIHGDGRFISGKVYYSDGEIGAGQYAELTDLDAPGTKPQISKTDASGAFRFPGIPGHHYRFLTEGEEGHTTEMRIVLADGAKGNFIDHDAPAPGWHMPPAWAVIGGLLLLISIPVAVRRANSRRS